MPHQFTCRVYYEDTDMAGIVYHANFLKFIERARSEWVAALGIDQREMKDRDGQVFVVRRIECDYLMPAYYGDDLRVDTSPAQVTGARMVLHQVVRRGDDILFDAKVTLVVIGAAGQPMRLPGALRQQLH
ncbi:tol-pal system-associated acyl-CoA thioesterase [Marinovum sp. 2_MG-2023]|uniref:tol-pal system-associated acyl-CoA thioesterase n=1 Tax=Roseobacteraceae TaxID=2854170 RepID=UPI001FD2E0F6|nr:MULTISPECIES: tol-pal system-associated acyl-CoA thioesterase [Roseobacteraceae]MCJ7873007.1 tol-pal system-associated acyl-CoA thioesterase [Phaeobacter sp. J2-8]MDO6731687.1 tol-pal system-associated acyl-CoA thioesterase [Marinovum sp. 2_MG-2023]MDO6780939.1 tol-pal system-associated acyl-CoA thioesterase [Marinovum sp. 1_MG-2023]